MKSQLMRRVLIALGVSACGVATIEATAYEPNESASGIHQSSDRWNQFRRPSTPIEVARSQPNRPAFGASVKSVAMQESEPQLPISSLPSYDAEILPPTAGRPFAENSRRENRLAEDMANRSPVNSSAVTPLPANPGTNYDLAGCQTCTSPYAAAMSSPWDGSGCSTCGPTASSCAPAVAAPKPIAPWFGGANLLFWNVSGSGDRPMVTYDNGYTAMRTGDLDPSGEAGFDVHFGRYFACGQYAIDVGYMLWDPECLCLGVHDGGAGLRFINPALDTVSINRGGGATTVYDDYDTNATAIQAIRDIRVQGLEINLTCFGLMGARRLGSCSPGPICGGSCGLLGCRGKYCGGATGPLARAAGGRLRIQNSHGFRWFQLEDELEIGGDVDGTSGFGASDLYYKSIVENNLFGYQFGSRLSYCLGSRMLINVGGKIGIYGNNAEYFHSINTTTVVAYTDSQGAGAGDVYTEESDVSLAGLGELDLGIGYRLSSCWTIEGGYRMLAACGVATAVGAMPDEYTTVASAGSVRADECFILHGAYVGFNYNW